MDILEGEDLMQTEDSEKYLGDIATNNGKNIKKIKARENRRPCRNELQKEYCVKIKLIALD